MARGGLREGDRERPPRRRGSSLLDGTSKLGVS
jgi:hypothetical protein